jgi:MSHA biogenesis protein MshJ
MKGIWLKWAERIDNAALRERVFIFGAVALVMVTVIENLFIDPLLSRQRRLAGEVSQQQGEIRQFQDQIQKSLRARGEDPDAANRARLQSLRQRLSAGESLIQGKQVHLVPADRVAALLGEILKRNRRLELVDLKTLPMANLLEPVGVKVAESAAQNAVPGNATIGVLAGERKIYRHGVQITVRGAYLDLLGYVMELEKLPQQMFWSRLEFAGQYPVVTMTITVYTLSLDKTWLVA